MQVILGSGGAIGVDLAHELKKYDKKVRLVSRNPQKINDDDELFPCDLTNTDEVEKAVQGADVAYLVVGLPYKAKLWEKLWPLMMQNVISACKKHKMRLVFFDNIYMYNPEALNPMTEETEIRPSSKKGKVRAQIAQMIFDEVAAGNIEALIARSADFYGPAINNGALNETVFKNLKAGKKAIWFCSLNTKHNYTYTPDAAKATALLGNTQNAYGQVWHLPTAGPHTGKEWIEMVASETGVKPKFQVASKFLISVMGLFNPVMKELVEMLYQYDRDYVFDSSKFETVFKMKATPVKIAIKEIVKAG
ncbi:NAD-dependent epimerase/dehydratase family protein [Maribellus maritimus]|uniref:NAD-dependent epimerase/dehydratase family protein n=1 Tax=Maribellus maritimus TaxID=2870838 RepID=UPI001EEACBB3|nr:NAD-dependent epimerase/dehydratase family protein [Maribellus maritimus]MCG6185939.1 NAD-dependent epimerase/dehydratase family protein [Maribellus maritimus]